MKTVLMAILAILSVVLAGVVGWQKLSQPEIIPVVINQPAVNQPVVKQPIVNQPVATTSDETAGWQTYKNEQYGFEIKYPVNWHAYPPILQGVDIVGFSNLSEGELKTKYESDDVENVYGFTIKIVNKQIDNWLQEQQGLLGAGEVDFLKEKITIGENEGYKISSIDKDQREYQRGFAKVLFTKEKVYLIETLFPEKCRYEECEVFNQMLSTFKFIK